MPRAHARTLIMRLIIGKSFYFDGNVSFCSTCTAGKYTGSTGLAECEPCSIGQYSNKSGASSCSYCVSPLSSYNAATECKVRVSSYPPDFLHFPSNLSLTFSSPPPRTGRPASRATITIRTKKNMTSASRVTTTKPFAVITPPLQASWCWNPTTASIVATRRSTRVHVKSSVRSHTMLLTTASAFFHCV